MTPKQHSKEMRKAFDELSEKKYMAGQKEHGGELWKKPVIGFIKEEVIDQWSYIYTIEHQWNLATELLTKYLEEMEASGSTPHPAVVAAHNVLKYGNEEGVSLSDG